jgi:hypothetical protein
VDSRRRSEKAMPVMRFVSWHRWLTGCSADGIGDPGRRPSLWLHHRRHRPGMRGVKEKGAAILRENPNATGTLTTIFVKGPNGLEMEIRGPG